MQVLLKKREAPKDDIRQPCGYCKEAVPKAGLKFCGRVCYLRHSVEVRQPVKLAQEKIAQLRQLGQNPGWDAEAREKREAGKVQTMRKRQPRMSPEDSRKHRAEQARRYRRNRKDPDLSKIGDSTSDES